MMQPKRQKFRKQFRGIWRRIAVKGNNVDFGSYGLKAMEAGWIKDRHLEAVRVILARATRKTGKFWFRVFPDKPYTKKPPEVTMGAGKGEVAYYVVPVVPGKILFEIDGIPYEEVKTTFKNAAAKLPLKTKIVEKI